MGEWYTQGGGSFAERGRSGQLLRIGGAESTGSHRLIEGGFEQLLEILTSTHIDDKPVFSVAGI
jgi:hypothetical protein